MNYPCMYAVIYRMQKCPGNFVIGLYEYTQSLMNRLYKAESAVFMPWMIYFQKILLSNYFRDYNLSLYHFVTVKRIPVHQNTVAPRN